MMKCEYCGRVSKPGETICSGCGAPIEQDINSSANSSANGRIEVSVGGVNIRIDGANTNVNSSTDVNSQQKVCSNQTKYNATEVDDHIKQRIKEENIRLDQSRVKVKLYAGIFRRTIAAWIDFTGYFMAMALIEGVLRFHIMDTKLSFIFFILYYVLCETYLEGATLGKKAMKIRVVNLEGEDISLGQGFIRFFAKFLLSCTTIIGYLMIAFGHRKQGLHDRIANTLVIRTKH